jgi:hypothetical protein
LKVFELNLSDREFKDQCDDYKATTELRLPRLLVFGDVPVEETYHGSLLLYRLLSEYPPDRLEIVETGNPSTPEQRLTGANYHAVPLANQRWLNTRFHSWFSLWFSNEAKSGANALPAEIDHKSFDAVLTVAHGFGWLAAARIAQDAPRAVCL